MYVASSQSDVHLKYASYVKMQEIEICIQEDSKRTLIFPRNLLLIWKKLITITHHLSNMHNYYIKLVE